MWRHHPASAVAIRVLDEAMRDANTFYRVRVAACVALSKVRFHFMVHQYFFL